MTTSINTEAYKIYSCIRRLLFPLFNFVLASRSSPHTIQEREELF